MLPGRISLVFLSAVTALTLGACSSVHVVPHRATPTLADLPPTTPVSAAAGVLYPPGLAGETHTRSNAGYRWVIPIGQESLAMFEAAWPRLFTTVVPLGGGALAGAGVDLLLEPSLQSFDFFLAGEGTRPGDAVVYRLDLSVPGGPMVASWTVRGQVPFKAGSVAPPSTGQATSGPYTPDQPSDIPTARAGWDHAADNIDDAARKLLASFQQRSGIDAYLARRAAGGSFELPLEGLTLQATVKDQLIDLPGGPFSLVALGILPVQVRIANGGRRSLPVEALVARLASTGGATVGFSGASSAVARLDLASTLATEPPTLLAGPLATIYWVARESEKRDLLPGVLASLEAKTLRPGAIPPGQAIEGLVYFALPALAPQPVGATVTMNLIDDDLHGATLTTQLAGLPAVSAAPRARPVEPQE